MTKKVLSPFLYENTLVILAFIRVSVKFKEKNGFLFLSHFDSFSYSQFSVDPCKNLQCDQK